jgi:hypothetical protein
MTSLGRDDVMIRCQSVLWLTWFAASPQPIHLRVGLQSRLVWLYCCCPSRGPESVVHSLLRFLLGHCSRWQNFTNLLQVRAEPLLAHARTHTHTRHGTLFHVHRRKKKPEKYHVILKNYERAPPDRSMVKPFCIAVQIGLYTLVTFTEKMS